MPEQATMNESPTTDIETSQEIDGQKDNGDWRSNLPEDLRKDNTLLNIEDVESLARAHIADQKYFGNTIKIPDTNAKPEDWNRIYNKLGRPQTADGYKIDRSKDPKGTQYDDGLQKEILSKMHEVGLNNAQAQGIINKWNQIQANRGLQLQKGQETRLNELHEEWGDSYDDNVSLASRAFSLFGGQEGKDYMNETGYGNDPVLVRIFAEIGKKMVEDSGSIGRGAGFLSKEEAQRKISEVMNDIKHPYHKGIPEEVEKMAEYFRLLNPQKE